jgi:hypothetical protein
MRLESHLQELEASDLIRLAQAQPEMEYLFSHALVQDAAYNSLQQLATLLHDLFFVYLFMGKAERAFALLSEARELFSELENLRMLAETLVFTCNTFPIRSAYPCRIYSRSRTLRSVG